MIIKCSFLYNSKGQDFYNSKKDFINEMKYNKRKKLGQEEGYRYNQARGNYLSLLRKDFSIDNGQTVEEVLNYLVKEIKYLSEIVEIFKEELINFK